MTENILISCWVTAGNVSGVKEVSQKRALSIGSEPQIRYEKEI